MADQFIVKPGMGVILNYFSIDFSDFSRSINPLCEGMGEICKDNKATYETFYLFGALDILSLGISDNITKLREMQQIRSHLKIDGVMDYFMHYGMVLVSYPKPFNLKEVLKENPIIGIITIKIRSIAWDEIYGRIKTVKELQSSAKILFHNAIQETLRDCFPKKDRLDIPKNYKALLLLSYDCEDIIVILFTDSFQFNKRFATKVRTLATSDIFSEADSQSNFKHIVSSTNTIFGVRLGNDIKEFSKVINTEVIPKCNKREKIYWMTFLQTLPGHLQHARNAISKIIRQENLHLSINPVVGRNDLLIYPNEPSGENIEIFLKTHLNFIIRFSRTPARSIISSETCITFPKLKRVESKRSPRNMDGSFVAIGRSLDNLIRKLESNEKISVLAKDSFIQLIIKLKYLLQDRYLHDFFITLYPLIYRGIIDYLKKSPMDTELRSELLTGYIELCYTNRYQGKPPIGETAVHPTLGHYSLGQKVLFMLDWLGNWIIKSFAASLPWNKFQPFYMSTINLNCSHGVSHLIKDAGSFFIFLPPQPVFYPELLLEVFFHELGHAVLDCYMHSETIEQCLTKIENRLGDKDGKNGKEEIFLALRVSGEIIAELFSAKMLSNLDFEKHWENVLEPCISSYGFPFGEEKKFKEVKKKHLTDAKKLVGILNKKGYIIDEIKPELGIDNQELVSHLVCFLQHIIKWEADDVTVKVREFLSSDKRQIEFWNLWILLYSQRANCYYVKEKAD